MSTSARTSTSQKQHSNNKILDEMRRESEIRRSKLESASVSQRQSVAASETLPSQQPHEIVGMPDRKSSLLENEDSDHMGSRRESDANSTHCFEISADRVGSQAAQGVSGSVEEFHTARPESIDEGVFEPHVEYHRDVNSFAVLPEENALYNGRVSASTAATATTTARQTSVSAQSASAVRGSQSVSEAGRSEISQRRKSQVIDRNSQCVPESASNRASNANAEQSAPLVEQAPDSAYSSAYESEIDAQQRVQLQEVIQSTERALESLQQNAQRQNTNVPEDQREREQKASELLGQQLILLRTAFSTGKFGDELFEQLFLIGRTLLD